MPTPATLERRCLLHVDQEQTARPVLYFELTGEWTADELANAIRQQHHVFTAGLSDSVSLVTELLPRASHAVQIAAFQQVGFADDVVSAHHRPTHWRGRYQPQDYP